MTCRSCTLCRATVQIEPHWSLDGLWCTGDRDDSHATAAASGDSPAMSDKPSPKPVTLTPSDRIREAWEHQAAREGRSLEDWLAHLAAERIRVADPPKRG